MTPADIINEANREPRPLRKLEGYRNISRWVEEEIWGHRLWSRQTPWLLFLEFLNVADFFNDRNALFAPLEGGKLPTYCLRDRLYLRNIVFNNSALERIASQNRNDEVKWEEWVHSMEEGAAHITDAEFSYLKKRFARFRDFANVVGLLRETAIIPASDKKRWLSRFLFPFGPSAIYRDLDAEGASDASNFGRTGELLYMMLARSEWANELAERLKSLMAPDLPGDRIVQRLLPSIGEPNRSASERVGGYLPYKRHPAYNRLASDWISILDLHLPSYDCFAHLVPLATLHILIYQLETAAAWLGRPEPHVVCEVIAPKPERIRELAVRSFINNDGLPRMAIHRVLDMFLESPEWIERMRLLESAPDSEKVREALELLEFRFWIRSTSLQDTLNVDDLIAKVHEDLDDKADNSTAAVHLEYGKQCGLLSRRGTRSIRYAPTDSLLKTLVLTNVPRRMELNDFLRILFKRYRFVFGPAEARQALGDFDYEESPFQANRSRLEERLRSMGMLNRLSDGLAYVENPAVI